jgi:hypothetical protein
LLPQATGLGGAAAVLVEGRDDAASTALAVDQPQLRELTESLPDHAA